MRRIAILLIPIAAGCGSGQQQLMPLQVGHAWSYHVISGMMTRVASLSVVRPVPVQDAQGYELYGPLGVSRLAWRGGGLVAEITSGLRFSPPIPLIASNGKPTKWTGTVTWLGRDIPANAELAQAQRPLTLDSRSINATESYLVLHLPSRAIKLITWFEPGVGIVKQEQRTGPKLDIGLDLISGP